MVHYKYIKVIDIKKISELFESVEWESAKYPEKLKKSIESSDLVLTAWENARLIGLMTAISDGGMNVYFPYLLINPEYHGKGIGRELVRRMLTKYNGYYRKILACNADKAPFYEKCGFKCCDDQRPMMIISS